MNLKSILLLTLIAIVGFSCTPTSKKSEAVAVIEETSSTNASSDNMLTPEEKASGWTLLFDGITIDQWHKYNGEGVGKNWSINDGALSFDPAMNDGGDLVTNEIFENFEFTLQWKIQDCGNSGIMWNVQEGKDYGAPYLTGPEMQVLDNKCHPDAKIIKHKSGDLYDMIETSAMTVKPAGKWNTIKIVSKDAKYSFYQNDVNVVNFEMHTAEWDELVANSKFKEWKDFGKFTSGKIALQDHGDKVAFKNIKIKKI